MVHLYEQSLTALSSFLANTTNLTNSIVPFTKALTQGVNFLTEFVTKQLIGCCFVDESQYLPCSIDVRLENASVSFLTIDYKKLYEFCLHYQIKQCLYNCNTVKQHRGQTSFTMSMIKRTAFRFLQHINLVYSVCHPSKQ